MSLPVDPDVVDVRLDNGLRLWSRPHAGPDGGIALALHVHAGSLGERDDERGLSHLIEHLAFTGGERVSPGKLIPLFARHGTVLGRDHNASTGFEWTVYTLSFPRASSLEDGLTVLADFADGLDVTDDALATERHVILEEMRHLDSADARIRRRLLAELAPRSRLVQRRPIGVAETVRSFERRRVLDYHHRWYRPERSTLVVVGELDSDHVRKQVERLFGTWAGDGDDPEIPDPGLESAGVDPEARPERTAVLEEPELAAAEIRRLRLRRRRLPGNLDVFREELIGRIATWTLEQRLTSRVRQGEVSFQDAALGVVPLLDAWALDQALARGPAPRAARLAEDFLREIRRATLHPLAESELDRAAETVLRSSRREVTSEEEASPARILGELSSTVPAGRPPMSRLQRLETLERVLPEVGPEEVQSVFRRRYGSDTEADRPGLTVAVLPSGSVSAASLASAEEDGLAGIVRRAVRSTPDPLRPVASGRGPRLDLPDGGSVATRDELADPEIVETTYENGIVSHLRSMDRRPDRFHAEVSLAGGRIREDASTFGLTGAAAIPFSHLETEDAAAEELREALVEADLRLTCSVDEDAVVLRLGGPTDALERGLAVVHRLLGRPRVDPGMLRLWQRQVEGREHAPPEILVARETARLLGGGDPRFAVLSAAQALAIDRESAQDWLDDLLLAPMEVAVVGDFERRRVEHLVRRAFGTLAPRREDFSVLRDPALRRLPPWSGPIESTVTGASGAEMERAALVDGWRSAPWGERRERRHLQLATHVLSLKLHREIRERRHLAYSVRSTFSPSPAYPAASLLSVSLYADPRRADEASRAVRDTVLALAEKGPSPAELRNVRNQAADLAERVEEDPKYWARVLAGSRLRDIPPRDFAGLAEKLRAVGEDDVRESLARCTVEERRLTVRCLPAVDSRNDAGGRPTVGPRES